MDYDAFLRSKERHHPDAGLDAGNGLNPALFAWQADIVRWALRKGRACLFEDCGLGKTFQQLEWARHVPGPVLIVTPLSVAEQTSREAARFGIEASVSRDGAVRSKITITNYEMLHRFDLSDFSGIVLDESSILKSHDGKTRNEIISGVQVIPYRLACTATPAPNDYMELGNHSEFVGNLTRAEMLATFFVHDGGDTAKWRLKGHAVETFWKWVASWAVMIRKPSDIGYDDNGFVLPELRIIEHTIETGITQPSELFPVPAATLNEQRGARRSTLSARVQKAAEIVASGPGPWLVWCELNAEGDELEAAIDGAIQVAGRHDDQLKAQRLDAFSTGGALVLVTKPSIAGFGMNWQHCSRMVFVGLSHSWEQFYQAVRRCWRFGQENEVEVHIISTDIERLVLQNIKRKQKEADRMGQEMVAQMAESMRENISGARQASAEYSAASEAGDGWDMVLGDCVEETRKIARDSIHYSIFSPPFASLYTYSDSNRDMGNCSGHDEFFDHFRHLIPELFRVTMPGRLLSFHCMNLPLVKERDGVIGLSDFRGRLISEFVDAGWIYHSEVCIWKDPVTAMQRTKALGLLHKQIRKDSAMSRQGIPDYLVTMRKPGENPERVAHKPEEFPVSLWQRYASPIWMDINQSDTLQFRSVRTDKDERHLCPLQLGVIRRAIFLWTNPGDVVFSPFAGIGSEGHVALEMGRRFFGIELKEIYFRQACANLEAAKAQLGMFGEESFTLTPEVPDGE